MGTRSVGVSLQEGGRAGFVRTGGVAGPAWAG
jgi:hypothetical protein